MKLDLYNAETIGSLFDLQERSDFFEDVIKGIYTTLLRPGDTAVDGGAQCGLHTYPMADCVGAAGKVHAHEVIPQLVVEMSSHLAMVGLTQVILHEMALSDHTEVTAFNWVKNNWGYSGLKQRWYPFEPEIELLQVATTKIDLSAPEDLVKWRFCKLDLEGGEFWALRGARHYLERYHPVIVFENGDRAATFYNYSIEERFEFFQKLNYRVFDLFGRPFSKNQRGHERITWYFIGVEDNSPDFDFMLGRYPAFLEEKIAERAEREGKSLTALISEPLSVLVAKAILYQVPRSVTHGGDSQTGANLIHRGKREEVCHGSGGSPSGGLRGGAIARAGEGVVGCRADPTPAGSGGDL